MTLLNSHQIKCYIISCSAFGLGSYLTIQLFLTDKVFLKSLYSGITVVSGVVGYKSDRDRQKFEPVNHRIQEYQGQQQIFAGMQLLPPPESKVNLSKISYDSLPYADYHISCIDKATSPLILQRLQAHLGSSFGVEFFDYRKFKSKPELMASIHTIRNLVISEPDRTPCYFIVDRYVEIEPTRGINFIVVSPENNPISNKLLDNKSIRLYEPLATEQIGYLDTRYDKLVGIG